ncbi:MAG: peptidoglycan editing factor PgeF [Parachlamydia sp.]|nr:peptidoglycan editing factor PgeF [Parachlamydia sp.]
MLRKEKDGIQWLEFELLAEFPRLKHGVLLRHGGHSTGAYASLNLNYGVGDERSHVEANLHKVSQVLNIPKLIWSNQAHGARVEHVATTERPKVPCDGMTTGEKDLGLLIHHADCQAAIFYDPVQHALGTVHCGWRGNVQNIYAQTVRSMQAKFGSDPKDLHVVISPSLGPENGEFIHYRIELPESFWSFQVKPTYFDLWAISEWQLQECGILPHHLQIARINTYAHPEDYFSYRRCKIRGGNATYAMLINQ